MPDNLAGSVGQAASATQEAVARAGDHPVVEWGARLGYAASGVLHLLMAWLGLQIALGGSKHQASQSGALATVARQPLGLALLWALAAGFALLAVWQVTEVVTQRDTGARAKAGAKAVTYAFLTWTSLTFAVGGHTSSNKQTKDITRTLMKAPGGRVVVGLVGVAILGVAAYHIYKGWAEKFLDDLRKDPGRWAVIAARIGYIGKGIALAAVGVLFIVAAVKKSVGKTTGLDAGLKSLRELPAGTVVLLAVVLGFAAYGVYSFARARYARV